MTTIVVADDKPSGRELIATVLEAAGYDVVEAENGLQALERVHEHCPALAVLDLQMPLLDGYSVARALRQENAFESMPLVALTAYAMPGDRERALAAGFTAYLTKPVNLMELRREVARLIASRASAG